jgi:hypothetical protein
VRAFGIVLLVAGYPVAIAVLVRLVAVLVRRRLGAFALLESATLCIVAGWSTLGNAVAATINGVFLVAFGVAWVLAGQSSPRRSTPDKRAEG